MVLKADSKEISAIAKAWVHQGEHPINGLGAKMFFGTLVSIALDNQAISFLNAVSLRIDNSTARTIKLSLMRRRCTSVFGFESFWDKVLSWDCVEIVQHEKLEEKGVFGKLFGAVDKETAEVQVHLDKIPLPVDPNSEESRKRLKYWLDSFGVNLHSVQVTPKEINITIDVK